MLLEMLTSFCVDGPSKASLVSPLTSCAEEEVDDDDDFGTLTDEEESAAIPEEVSGVTSEPARIWSCSLRLRLSLTRLERRLAVKQRAKKLKNS